MSRIQCEPARLFCCDAFAASFARGDAKRSTSGLFPRFRQDETTGLVTDQGEVIRACPFCGTYIDPVVKCGFTGCGVELTLSAAFIDNRRFLCEEHGLAVRDARKERTTSVRRVRR